MSEILDKNMIELRQLAKEHPLPGHRGLTPPEKRLKTLTDQHVRACLMKVEEGLNDAQIAEREGVSARAVAYWWKKPHVIRELRRTKERFNSETRPAIIQRSEAIREKGMEELEKRIVKDETKTSDVIGAIKLTNEMIAGAQTQELEDEENTQAKEEFDALWDNATPEEREMMARIAANLPRKTPSAPEAEVIDVEDEVTSAGSDQETST